MSKNISSALRTFLLDTDGNYSTADLIAITLSNGDTLNVLQGTNQNITYNGTTYYCSQFGSWNHAAITGKASFRPESNNMNLTALLPTSGANAVYYPGTTTTLLSCVNLGLFNGARVSIESLFWTSGSSPSSGFSMGTMKLYAGQIGNAQPAGVQKVTFSVQDYLFLLAQDFPPHQIQTQCRHVLFDSGCTLLKANYTSNSIGLDASSTNLYLNCIISARQNSHGYSKGDMILVSSNPYFCFTAGTSAASAPTFNSAKGATTTDGGVTWLSMNSMYPLGYIKFLTGANAGLVSSIKVQLVESGLLQLQLARPTALNVAGGDTLELVPGCDLSLATCALYNNANHFGGMPNVPSPETAAV